MQWWMLGAASNGVIAISYFMISFTITRGLLKSGQLSTNRLGAATARDLPQLRRAPRGAHGAHADAVHRRRPRGRGWRCARPGVRSWRSGTCVSAFIGVYYWTLRGGFGSVGASTSPQLFEDQREREQRALELNDAVLQGMVVARMALDLGEGAAGAEGTRRLHLGGQPR